LWISPVLAFHYNIFKLLAKLRLRPASVL